MGHLEEVGEEAARDAGEEGADREGEDLVLRRVDAHELGGELVLAYGEHGPPVGGLHEIADDQHGEEGRGEDHREGGELGDAEEAAGPAHEVHVVEGRPDDLAEAQVTMPSSRLSASGRGSR